MRRSIPSRRTRHGVAVGALTFAVLAHLCGTALAAATTTTTAARTGITRTPLGQAAPTNAPGQTLYLQRVTIDPGSRLAEHFHEGTQVAHVVSGALTYDVVSGTATVTRADGRTESVTGPKTITLRRGDSLVEIASLVHYGSNQGRRRVVIELAALLRTGAPLATPTGSGTGTPLHLSAPIESSSRVLHEAANNAVYGWNMLNGTATLDGQPVGIEMLASIDYDKGNGPFFGFVTFAFTDGSTLAVQMQGATTASADTTSGSFVSTLGVIAGTGRYANATGTGTFTGTRTAALGTSVSSNFDLTLNGVS